jgi:hypothetical protein
MNVQINANPIYCRKAITALDERVYDTLLEIAIDDPVKRADNRKIWKALEVLHHKLQEPMPNPEDEEQRKAKSIICEDMPVVFVDALSAAVGEELCTLYCHHAMRHIPDIIRDVPLNIGDLSQQGFEHLLKLGKSDLHNFTNKRLRGDGQDKGRNYQVLAKERERRRIKRDVPGPPTRNERRILGGVKARNAAALQVVNRAERRGQLASRSAAQSAKRVTKQEGPLLQILQRIQTVRQLTDPLKSFRSSASTAASESGLA